jgi:UDP-N-acetyl-D-glucosamine dehydrogenase
VVRDDDDAVGRSHCAVVRTKRGARITYSDPHAPEVELDGATLRSDDSAMAAADCVVIVTNHSAFNYEDVVAKSRLVVDTRNACKGMKSPNIVRL